MLFLTQAAAMSPVLFFRQVERVGVLCTVDAEPAAAHAAPAADRLCDAARAVLASLLGADGPPVLTLTPNDERIADPATLVVLLHAQTRTAAVPGAADAAVTALAATLHRSRPDLGAPPFFLTPPEAVVAAGGPAPPDTVDGALRRLLAGVARPLRANP